jgi:hypothetical protein
MINLSTPSEQLLKELLSDTVKAEYWLKKQYHGEKGYQRMLDELELKCAKTRKNQKSDIVEYKSPTGNRWLVYAFCRCYAKAEVAKTTTVSFCYYETLGSIGAFFINYDKYDIDYLHPVVIIFTSHFFQRFCERLGIEYRSRAMVQRFCEVIPGYLIYTYKEKDKNGHIRVDVRLPGSIGRGIMRSEKGALVYEIRSYLTDKQLSKAQLRETEELRRLGDKYESEPLDVWWERIKPMKWEDKVDEIQKAFDQSIERGVDPRLYQVSLMLSVFMCMYVVDHKLMDTTDEEKMMSLSKRMNNAIHDPLCEYVFNGGEWRPIPEAFGIFMQQEFRGVDLVNLYKEMEEYFRKVEKEAETIDK